MRCVGSLRALAWVQLLFCAINLIPSRTTAPRECECRLVRKQIFGVCIILLPHPTHASPFLLFRCPFVTIQAPSCWALRSICLLLARNNVALLHKRLSFILKFARHC